MILRHLFEPSLAQSSYLIGCAETGEALVIDPNLDVARYVSAAEAEGLRIVGVAETHIHADFVSGSRALAAATGATLYVSGEGGRDWQSAFAGEDGVRVLRDGDVIDIGRIRLTAVHTPGHTPEHLMYVVTDTRAADAPLGAFTGDFLFVGDVGRPDLLETAAKQIGTMETSARRLYESLRRLRDLPDYLLIWPGHGSGSACGKNLGGVPVSSLGYERLTNWGLRELDERAFVQSVLADQPDPPMYFAEMKHVNKVGAPAWSSVPALPLVDDDSVAAAVAAGLLIVDVRSVQTSNLLPGAIAVPLAGSFSAWAGSLVPSGESFLIIADDDGQAATARRSLGLIGRSSATGWISPSQLSRYQDSGGPVSTLSTTDRLLEGYTLVDVRSSAEWTAGHLPGARHAPLARLQDSITGFDRSTPLLLYCQSGVRSIVAATALRRLGFTHVTSLAGGLSSYRRHAAEGAAIA